MAVTITDEQRDAIYEEVLSDLSGVGDILLLLSRQDHEAARTHRRRFEDDMRLLDDHGWQAEQPGDEFVLTMPQDDLARGASAARRQRGSDAPPARRVADRGARAAPARAGSAGCIQRPACPAQPEDHGDRNRERRTLIAAAAPIRRGSHCPRSSCSTSLAPSTQRSCSRFDRGRRRSLPRG
jgi:hypothetical protein